MEKIEKIERDSEEYVKRMFQVAVNFCPTMYPCKTCGSPVINGYCCTYCNDVNPRGK